ncbi:hypothetical protein C1Y63_00070 [Corynebacterium sp. 13CS0277]|uniref:hypothetical protein n=1 Tax=Corynebacterium sp. 13CS0277 TaxID=2071994 RepID=UPI000D0333F3|nr:hypothetical protein [Corynebacterium sp. 13CS0277]PRQ12497.1 hypothetical protein C1Y63_00070 [Corynebacterium sp. 13CS0277]
MSMTFLNHSHSHTTGLLPQLVVRPREDLAGEDAPTARPPHRAQLPSRRSPVVLALSATLGTSFVTQNGAVSWEQLYQLPGSTVTWWNRAAENVLAAINHPQAQLQFLPRGPRSGPRIPRVGPCGARDLRAAGIALPAAPGPQPQVGISADALATAQVPGMVLEVRVPGKAAAKDWLAHPCLFSILHDSACRLMDAEVEYLAFADGRLLLAASMGVEELMVSAETATAEALVSSPIVYSAGYPAATGVDQIPATTAPHPMLMTPFRSLTRVA